MIKKSVLLLGVLAAFLGMENPAICAEKAGEAAKEGAKETIDYVEKGNQMMMAFMERIKIGDLEGARKIAKSMTEPAKNFTDSDSVEYKCFYSEIEKEYYLLKNKGSKKTVEWVQEPIADGYYLLAVLDFQDKHYKDALENIQNCVFWNPVRAPYFCERGFLYLYAGEEKDLVNAQVAYEKAVELADSNEDMATALRGIAAVMNAKDKIQVSIAALILSKEYDSEHTDLTEQLLFLKENYPEYNYDLSPREARNILKDNNIQCDYSHEHVEVLLKVVSKLKMPEEKERAVIFLNHARMLEPQNVEILNKLKSIQ